MRQTFTAVFTPDEDGWVSVQLAEWAEVVSCGRSIDEAKAMIADAAREMAASYREENRVPPFRVGHAQLICVDLPTT